MSVIESKSRYFNFQLWNFPSKTSYELVFLKFFPGTSHNTSRTRIDTINQPQQSGYCVAKLWNGVLYILLKSVKFCKSRPCCRILYFDNLSVRIWVILDFVMEFKLPTEKKYINAFLKFFYSYFGSCKIGQFTVTDHLCYLLRFLSCPVDCVHGCWQASSFPPCFKCPKPEGLQRARTSFLLLPIAYVIPFPSRSWQAAVDVNQIAAASWSTPVRLGMGIMLP